MNKKIYEDYEKIEEFLNKEYSIDDYKDILSRLADEKSKTMFFYRVMFDNTNDAKYALLLEKMMYFQTEFYSESDRMMYDFLCFLLKDDNYKKKMYFIGFPFDLEEKNMNMWSYLCFINHRIGCLDVECILDENYNYVFDAWEKKIEVRDINEIYNIKIPINSIIISCNNKYKRELTYLYTKVPKESIFQITNMISFSRGKQYFYEDFIRFSNEEVFFDGGTSDLETSLDYINIVGGKYKKIYGAEPYIADYNTCLQIINKNHIENIQMENVGLWSEDTELKFNACGFGSSNVNNEGKEVIRCKTIDSILDGKEVSVIKMDIEGAEYEALKGASNSILKYHPMLMICIYHKPNDVFKLSKLVLDLRDDYDLYIRHYSYTRNETVLYFIPKKI